METSSSALYGKGIFTTVSFWDGNKFLWVKHWKRLTLNACKIGIDLSGHTEDSVLAELDREIKKHGLAEGRARITFFDARASELWPSESDPDKKVSPQILVGKFRPVPEPFKLTISPSLINSSSPLAGVKSCNYLEQILTKDEASARGFNEAIRINERGHVTSGCMSNIFWLLDDRLYTPALSTGCLEGTTREYVLENLECEEVEEEIGELDSADAIYLTSAGIGVAQVAEFGVKRFARIDHPILHLLPY